MKRLLLVCLLLSSCSKEINRKWGEPTQYVDVRRCTLKTDYVCRPGIGFDGEFKIRCGNEYTYGSQEIVVEERPYIAYYDDETQKAGHVKRDIRTMSSCK